MRSTTSSRSGTANQYEDDDYLYGWFGEDSEDEEEDPNQVPRFI